MTSVLFPILAVGMAVSVAACSADGGEAVCRAHVSTTNTSTPGVSFRRDVVPIFESGCAFSSCHGSMGGANNGVYLGGRAGTTEADRVFMNLVSVSSKQLSAMLLVRAGDPEQSYLQRKIDGDQCTLDARCAGGRCGDAMPKGADPLPLESRDTIRRWIAQGARND